MPRRPKLQRSKNDRIVLTERDRDIIIAVHRFRFMNVNQIMKLTDSKNRNSMNRRLRLLYDNKYLDRVEAQLVMTVGQGSIPMIYALGTEGVNFLRNNEGINLPMKADWRRKNREAKPHFINHTLSTTEFVVSMMVACRERADIRFISTEEILAKASNQVQKQKEPFKWDTQIRWGGELYNIMLEPDYVFGLEYLNRPQGKNRAYFFVEIDQGRMSVVRRHPHQTSILRKMKSYADTHARKIAFERFGIRNFRVLTVTKGPGRVETMIGAYQDNVAEEAPARLFYFSDRKSLSESNALCMFWKDGKSRIDALSP